jgi:4-amino-4-deoxy-L-arabinose transferase-like glycosyltransferase
VDTTPPAKTDSPCPAWTAWEAALLAAVLLLTASLGFANLGLPSLWHDELVHVYVGKSLAEAGTAQLPSGAPYYSGALFNATLGVVIALAGDGEFAVRAPSVVCSVLNVLLLYLLVRRWAGRSVAIAAALMLALSPWSLAWARQARFYSLQQTLYLVVLGLGWAGVASGVPRARQAGAAIAAFAVFLLAMLTSYHSILFLAPLGACLGLRVLTRRQVSDLVWMGGIVLAGLAAFGIMRLLMNPTDVQATTTHSGLGLHLDTLFTWDRWYYLTWLGQNLSTGFLILLFPGTVLAVLRHGWRGCYWAMAFWAPLLALTLLLDYRWSRFLFFAYPAFVLLQAIALVALIRALARFRNGLFHAALALVLLLFTLRLGQSAIALTGDSVEVARGADTTLAIRHPQWRKPCQWVREQGDGAAILASSYLPVHYHTGRVDDWFPNSYFGWEAQDSGLPGIGDLDALARFMANHPRGFFIVEAERFERWRHHGAVRDTLAPMVAWVQSHMRLVPEASSADVTVYAWGEGVSVQ